MANFTANQTIVKFSTAAAKSKVAKSYSVKAAPIGLGLFIRFNALNGSAVVDFDSKDGVIRMNVACDLLTVVEG